MADTGREIREGVTRLSRTTTAAELVAERGEAKRVKVMSKSRLRELIQSVISAELSLYADRLDGDERAIMEQDAEKRIDQVLKRARKDEKQLAERSIETKQLLAAIGRKIADAGLGDEVLTESLEHLEGLIAQSESMTQYCLHDMMCLKEEMDKVRRLVEAGSDAAGMEEGDTALLKEVARGRTLLQLCRACEALVGDEAIIDLAVLLDEAPGQSQLEELIRLNDAASQAVIGAVNG